MTQHPYKEISGVQGCAEGFTDPGPVWGQSVDAPVHEYPAPYAMGPTSRPAQAALRNQ